MSIFSLHGRWTLQQLGGVTVPGEIPGCNYLDLMRAGVLDDPYYGLREGAGTRAAEYDYVYSRAFEIDPSVHDLLEQDAIDLVISQLDTLAEITLNGTPVAQTSNMHRIYRFPVKHLLRPGKNEISILFRSPLEYIRNSRAKRDIHTYITGEPGCYHLRKVQCHFGWDWGPVLPPSGITGDIHLEGYRQARIAQVSTKQHHRDDTVTLFITADIDRVQAGPLYCNATLTAPDGTQQQSVCTVQETQAVIEMTVRNPQLWWCNGLGAQPLYTLTLSLTDEQQGLNAWTEQIGLRSITLNTQKDQWGSNFQFFVNGVPIFAKGANWIPTDCFVTRTTPQTMEWYIKSAHDANMNMLRVWGGGYYESDLFYQLCDKYGILVWQDFAFACALYPFDDDAFRESVLLEVRDNVRRLRNHASLALWCGNNEMHHSVGQWHKYPALYKENNAFLFQTLPAELRKHDTTTPYWPSSPLSFADRPDNATSLHHGDSHLWYVWHGMLPIEAYRRMPARFCSEFGMESFPSLRAIAQISKRTDLSIDSPVMLTHQKCASGNAKIQYYLLAKYRNPANLEEFIYLSQLMQAETMRYATEFWRRNTGRCNGALYWQYNDCWPVASWSSIDYAREHKALQYKARHFNAMVCVSADLHKNHADFYVINDHPQPFSGTLDWKLVTLDGRCLKEEKKAVRIAPTAAQQVCVLHYSTYLRGARANNAAMVLRLYDESGAFVHEQMHLLVPDKKAKLKKPRIHVRIAVRDGIGTIKLVSDTYARFVQVQIAGVTQPLSDNYFDLPCGEVKTITFPIDATVTAESLLNKVHLHSLADVKYSGNILDDARIRLRILANPKTHLQREIPTFSLEAEEQV